ncbi:hypothetical protein ACFYTC_01830 [Actinomadura nitritigenes]|uniref:hypothetical protein n=1 Tax=Actinomadura nitritigenes TaxID=134602 RepID=UPI00369A67E9
MTSPIVLVSVDSDQEAADLRSFTLAMATVDAAARLFGLWLGWQQRAGEVATRMAARGHDEV